MTKSAGPVLKALHEEFGDVVDFVTLYVREAHPGDRYPQPETFEQKMEYARAYKQRDRIPWKVAVDDVDGSLHQKLDPKPNALYVMAPDGTVAFRALWSNDRLKALREGLAVSAQGGHHEREANLLGMMRGVGAMREALRLSGRQAERDVLTQAPPVYVMAWLSSLFRPLPYLGRSMMASALMVALIAPLVVVLLKARS